MNDYSVVGVGGGGHVPADWIRDWGLEVAGLGERKRGRGGGRERLMVRGEVGGLEVRYCCGVHFSWDSVNYKAGRSMVSESMRFSLHAEGTIAYNLLINGRASTLSSFYLTCSTDHRPISNYTEGKDIARCSKGVYNAFS